MVVVARHRASRDLLARPDRTSSECRCQIAALRAHFRWRVRSAVAPPTSSRSTGVSGGLARDPASAPASELGKPCTKARLKVGLDGPRLILRRNYRPLQRALVPKVDVQPLDLLDQDQDRAPRGPYFLARVAGEPVAPATEQFELLFVKTLHHIPMREQLADHRHLVKEPPGTAGAYLHTICRKHRVCARHRRSNSVCTSGRHSRATRGSCSQRCNPVKRVSSTRVPMSSPSGSRGKSSSCARGRSEQSRFEVVTT